MNVFPVSLDAARLHENLDSFDLVISIFDPKFKNTDLFCNPLKRIVVHFEDTEHPDENEFLWMNRGVSDILSKTKNIKNPNILVHCHAGVSRSSAIAWLIRIQHGQGVKEAFQEIFAKCPNIWPNTTIMDIGSGILKNPDISKIAHTIEAEISEKRQNFLGYGG